MREWLEFAAAWTILQAIGSLPPPKGPRLLGFISRLSFFFLRPKLRKTADFNLCRAFPDMTDAERNKIRTKMVRNLGWMAAEFAGSPRLTKENIGQVVILDGH